MFVVFGFLAVAMLMSSEQHNESVYHRLIAWRLRRSLKEGGSCTVCGSINILKDSVKTYRCNACGHVEG